MVFGGAERGLREVWTGERYEKAVVDGIYRCARCTLHRAVRVETPWLHSRKKKKRKKLYHYMMILRIATGVGRENTNEVVSKFGKNVFLNFGDLLVGKNGQKFVLHPFREQMSDRKEDWQDVWISNSWAQRSRPSFPLLRLAQE